ncbi:MAG: hypothetical protein ACOY40_16015 [Bacillota bacterium]
MIRKFLEKNLQEPFFLAEMYKAQVSVAGGAESNLGTIKAMELFGAVYMTFCMYWFARYIIG